MSKGTASKGLKGRAKLHFRCRRCGHASYHKKSGICSNCGYGRTSKIRSYSWQKKHFFKKFDK